jgi:hypothetical protein
VVAGSSGRRDDLERAEFVFRLQEIMPMCIFDERAVTKTCAG